MFGGCLCSKNMMASDRVVPVGSGLKGSSSMCAILSWNKAESR